MRMRATFLAVVLLAALPALAGAAAPATLTYRGDASHDHRITGAPDAPLGVLWAADLGARSSYPVVAAGLVFVSVRNTESYGTTLYALDAATGAVRWTRANPGTYWYGGMAYDQGRLYVLNFDGNLVALVPGTGALLWATSLPGQYAFSGTPVGSGGDVYVIGSGSGGTVYAVDGEDGTVRWSRGLPTGGGSPAVDASSVYVSLVCEHHYAFARDSGVPRWERHGTCTGGGDVTPALHGGRVYPFGDSPAILDATSGDRVGSSAYHGAGSFGDGTAYVPWDGGVIAVDDPGWLTRWTYRATGISGEAPLVADRQLYVAAEGGAVLALDRASGQPVWCAGTGGQDVAGTGHDDHPGSHLGAGGGLLYVPAGRFLIAYGPGGAPALPCAGIAGAGSAGAGGPGSGSAPPAEGPGLSLQPAKHTIRAGRRARLAGVLRGLASVAGAPVELQVDPWPFDGAWRTVGATAAGADGSCAFALHQRRNARYRALGGGLTSAEVVVYAELAAKLERRSRAGATFREVLRIRGPQSARVAARRVHFYLLPADGRVARLQASPRLRRIAPGVYGAAATLRYLRPRRATTVLACYRERTPDPWGPVYAIDPICGRDRIVLPAAGRSPRAASDATARFTRSP